jgi:CRISPR type IV-associated protein Csf3
MERLKITAHLKRWQVIYNWDLYFDAILYSYKQKKDLWETRRNREIVDKQQKEKDCQMQLPIKRHTDEPVFSFDNEGNKVHHTNKNSAIWLSSRAIIEPLWEQRIHINKRFQNLRYEKRGGKEKKKVYLSMWKYKNYQVIRRVIMTPTVSRIVIGDKERIQEMLNNILYIWKEKNVGYGRVDHWSIEPSEEIWCRHFPSQHFAPHEIKEYKRCLPPYWAKQYMRSCAKRYF